ncbi:hypothetical protein IMY05_005G0185900 [Salix suchowensis]|nr:hypothetical protein IMY05_005G0185900 [Salix suchowensis]
MKKILTLGPFKSYVAACPLKSKLQKNMSSSPTARTWDLLSLIQFPSCDLQESKPILPSLFLSE